jgi:Ca2+-binding RTX toxin-like protein
LLGRDGNDALDGGLGTDNCDGGTGFDSYASCP